MMAYILEAGLNEFSCLFNGCCGCEVIFVAKLMKEGFEYVCDMEGIKLFRKRK
ncbi:MAG: hypothetical protein QXL38_01135 [Candidatus Bathyarchaeia archaeon]